MLEKWREWWWRALLAVVLVVCIVPIAGSASADPASDLAGVESRAANAEAEVAGVQLRLDAARAEYAAASRRARPIAKAARAARARERELRSELVARQREARTRIAELQATQREEEENHDEEIAMGIGFGLATLIAAAIAIGWGWFRAAAPVAALTRLQLARAFGLCLGGGVLLIAVGALLGAGDGGVGAVGALIFWLGFVLPAAFLLGRHSMQVEAGRAKPLLKQKRLPLWVPRAAAALLLLLGLGAFGTAVFSDQPSSASVSTPFREDAETLSEGPGAQRLREAEAEVATAQKRAVRPVAQQRAARVALRGATRQLNGAKSRLVDVQSDVRRFESRLSALLAREEREAAREAEEAADEEEELSACDPNYSGCVPPYPPDVDCDEVGESVSVYGSDPHGLDADADGIGCE